MSYKIVRNASGEVICFGPNTDQYQPVIPPGAVMTVEASIPPPSLAAIEAEQSDAAKRTLERIDLDSIRSIREYIAAKPDAPVFLKDLETAALGERVKVKV